MKPPVDAPIDFDRLREVSDDDPEMMNTLTEMYLEQIQEILTVLKIGVAKKDFDTVRKAAHKAVGSSATCGINLIVPVLRKLEHLGVGQAVETADELITEVEAAYNQIRFLLGAKMD